MHIYHFQSNMFVTTLDLSGNTVGREGMECLVQMLEENLTIKELVSNLQCLAMNYSK